MGCAGRLGEGVLSGPAWRRMPPLLSCQVRGSTKDGAARVGVSDYIRVWKSKSLSS